MDVLLILLPTIVFVSWANVIRTQCLLPEKRDFEYCLSVISGAVINLVMNTVLIPTRGASGAAIGTLVAEGTVCVIQSFICAKKMPFVKYVKYSIPFAFCAIGMQICIMYINLQSIFFTIFVRIIVGTSVYIALSTILLKNAYVAYKEWR